MAWCRDDSGARGAAALVALVLVAGCGGGSDPGPGAGPTDAADAPWRSSSDPVPTDGLVWAADGTVHLADGTEVETGALLSAYVVAGDGVFFVAAESEAGVATPGIEVREVQFAAPGTDPVATGVEIQADTLVASPDGRYVGGLDMVSGEEDGYGTPVAVARVFDLRSGEEVLSTSEGLGDPGDDDLAVLYEDVSIGLRLSDDVAYVDEAEGDWAAYPLPSGDREPLPDGEEPTLPDLASPTSPDGAWRIVDDGLADRLESSDGEVVRPRTGTSRWTLDRWLSDDTVVGIAVSGPGGSERLDRGDTAQLMSCVVPSGRCTVVPDTAGRLVIFPWSPQVPAVTLPGGA